MEITGRLAQLAEAIWSPIKALFMYPISSLKARRLEFFGSGGSADLLQAQRTPQTRRPRGPWSAGPTPPRSPERTAAPSPTKGARPPLRVLKCSYETGGWVLRIA